MTRPFEISFEELDGRLEEMVDATFSDLESQFLVLPKGPSFIEYSDFQDAYETLKRQTSAFNNFKEDTVWNALKENALCFVIIRTILGLSPPEWADLAKGELDTDVDMGSARTLDSKVRKDKLFFQRIEKKSDSVTLDRAQALIQIAIKTIEQGAPAGAKDTVHRLAKADTAEGLVSLRQMATVHVPYAILLYERYLGRPFASHRDSVSGLVGDVMESAIEERLSRAGITFRKTRRAERIAGFDQAPDFFVPTEISPSVVIEAKITGDDGTARDKVARILRLAHIRDQKAQNGERLFELIACIDGRGFGVRRQDMRDMLRATKGKIFTLATLDHLISNTQLKQFLPRS